MDHFSINLKSRENFEQFLHHIERMKVQVLANGDDIVNTKSFTILDPDKIKIRIYNR
jgi:hypothetical protein